MMRAIFAFTTILLTSTTWADLKIIRSGQNLLEAAPDQAKSVEPNFQSTTPEEVPNPLSDLIPGKTLNLRSWLEGYGCQFNDDDIALFFSRQGLVLVRSNQNTVDRVEMLVEAWTPPPVNLRVVLSLAQKGADGESELCRVETLTQSGCRVTGASPECTFEVEPTLGADQLLLNSRVVFTGRGKLDGLSVATALNAQISKPAEIASWSAGGNSTKVLTCNFEVLPALEGQLTNAGLESLSLKAAEVLGR